MYRSIVGALACLYASLGVFTALPLVGRLAWSDPTVAQRVSISVVLGVVAVLVLLRGERTGQLVLLVVTFVLATPALGTFPVANDSTVGMLLSAIGVMAARLQPMTRALALVAVLGAVHAATVLLLDLPQAGLSLDAMVLVVGTAAAAIGFVNAMQASAIETERVAASNRERERDLTRAEAELAARTMSRRILHDDVLGTLHLLSDSTAPPERVRQQCRTTVEAIRGVISSDDHDGGEDPAGAGAADPDPGLPESYAGLVEALRAQSPVPVDLDVAGRPQRLPVLGEEHRSVLVRAAAEGVRNAVRHGHVDAVTVRLAADRNEVRVEVLDRGVGPGPAPRKGFGLRESVERPLAQAGGRSALLERPGGGAALVLAIPRDPGGALHHAYGLTTNGLGPVRGLARTVALPLGLAWSVVVVNNVVRHPETWTSVVVAVGWLAVTAAIVRRIERGGPGPAWVTLVALATVVVQVLGLALLPAGAMLDFRSWSIGMSAVPLVVLLLSLPLPIGLPVLLVHVLLVLLAPQVRPELTGGLFPWGSLNAVITCPVPSLVLGTLIRRQGRSLRDLRRLERALDQRRAADAWRATMTDLYFTHVRDEVLPWLDEIARGERTPDAPDTVAHARLLAVAARDDLYAPGFFDDALRDDVARFRSEGGVVELRAGLHPGAHERALGRVLRALLPASPGRRIIVTPPAADDRRVRISIVPAPDAPAIDAARAGAGSALRADVDPYRAVLLVDDLPGSG
ncbi:signal transduction histidine kinase [Nocardioides cavernae]|uniref:Signal transduction histidine kinase n=1 Tax=Nocardioides cavernae TaxID=1921566 RepID=A0A7Y9KP49_9ACTN|nr:hypothetical protein [Nocardioides cavernae]NYE36356.1 signal transduction histidine kinase [Nocardioides cavernae]